MGTESAEELTQDVLLSLGFFLVTIFSGWRLFLYFSLTGGGKVVTSFFFLITFTSLIRCIWFIIPSEVLEGTYTPTPMTSFETKGWVGVILSELMLSFGNLSLFGVFLLVICYWAQMLHKVENPEIPETNYLLPGGASSSTSTSKRRGPLETFGVMMLVLFSLEIFNILFFLFRFYNSEVMILFDSLLFSFISLATLIAISIFSNRIRVVLTMMGMINGNSTKQQVRRILAITVAANIFFIVRLLIELSTSLYLVTLWTCELSFPPPSSHLSLLSVQHTNPSM
jgi:hypothetical protein